MLRLSCSALGAVIFALVLLVGARAGEEALPDSATEKKSGFDIPVWHPDARWERADDFAGVCSIPSDLGGPRQEVMWRGSFYTFQYPLVYLPGQIGPYPFRGYDAKTERIHALSGGASGLLDGPLSRARNGGYHYRIRPYQTLSSDRRFFVLADAGNGRSVRIIDLKEQMVRTALPPGSGAQAAVFDSKGRVLVLTAKKVGRKWEGRVVTVDAATAKPVKEMTLKASEGIRLDRYGAGLALDEKKGRLYASGDILKKDGKKWHVWYLDLNDGGSWHGVLAGEKAMMAYTGPFDTYKGYGETSISFGPDDPEKRFLYVRITDTPTFVRLDLKRRMVAACSGPSKEQPQVMFIESGKPNKIVSHVGPIWLPNGDFITPAVWGPAPYFRRVK